MKRPSKINIKPKILIFILTLICIATLILSVTVKSFSTPFKTVAGVVIVPLQEESTVSAAGLRTSRFVKIRKEPEK